MPLRLPLITLSFLCALACSAPAPPAARPSEPQAAAPSPPSKPAPTESLTFLLPWKVGGTYSPFYLAQKHGYNAEQGLDVEIQEGSGSGVTAKVVAAGSVPIGFIEGGVAIQSVSEELPIKVVAGIIQKSPASIMVAKSSGITTPADLEGKRIAAPPGSSPVVILEPWLKANGVDPSKVQTVATSPQGMLNTLLQGQVDGVSAFYVDNVPLLQARGLDATYILYADYGFNIPGSSIIVNTGFAREKPDTVRRFVAAALKAHAEAQRDPAASIASIADLAGTLDAKVETASLVNIFDLLHTERTQGKPLGWMAREDWEAGISILAAYADLKNRPQVDDLITNEFVPAQ
jgi:NitT/TauT family transport system substrate-binding protein